MATPASLVGLSKLAKQYTWADAPESLTAIRNGLVHPKNKLRQSGLIADAKTLIECRRLGLWFLELVLLRLMDYEGIYVNRLHAEEYKTDSVPWTRQTP